MRHHLIATFSLALALGVTGCTMGPGVSTDPVSGAGSLKTASLDLSLDWMRQTQALMSDITDATLSVTVPGKPAYLRTFAGADLKTTVHLDGLPTGDATIRMEAAQGSESLGSGMAYAPLLAGRRSSVRMRLVLDSRGDTNLLPFTPLGPIDLASALASQLIGFVDDGSVSGGRYDVSAGNSGTQTVSGDQGQVLFANLYSGQVQLRYGYDYPGSGPAYAAPKVVAYAVSEPATVSATQTAIPTASLDIGWDFSTLQPQPNTTLTARTFELSWPAKPGVEDPKYVIELYNSWNYQATPVQTLETSARRVSLTLDDRIQAGTRYLVLKYKRGSGTYGGGNAHGRSQAIPLVVPAPVSP